MRVVVVSVAMFLCVTVLVLHRASAESSDGEVTSSESTEITAVAPLPSATSSPAMTADMTITQQPSAPEADQTPTRQATLPVLVPEPTPTPDVSIETNVVDEPAPVPGVMDDVIVEPESEAVEETEPEAVRNPLSAGEMVFDAELVAESLFDDPAWSGAIHTRDGGVIGMVISGTANVRAEPTTSSDVVIELHDGWPVTLYAQVSGEWVGGTDVWYQTWSGSYVSAAVVVPFIAPEPETVHSGHWLDVNLSLNYAIAYVDDTPINAMIVMTGMEGFETPVGDHTIFRRVETDTLDAGTLGYEEDDPEYYYLTGVNYVQYFADGGFALHSNYWSDPWEFGLSRSHGCINLMEEDAAWLWLFLTDGSIISVHQ